MPKASKNYNCSVCKKGGFKTKYSLTQHKRVCKHNNTLLVQKKNKVRLNRDTKTYSITSNEYGNHVRLKSCRLKRYKTDSSHVMTYAYIYIGGRSVKVLVHELSDGLVIQPYELWNKYEFESFFRLPLSCKGKNLKLNEYALKVF